MDILNAVISFITDYILIILLLVAAVVWTVRTRGVQFRLAGEMFRLLFDSGRAHHHEHDSARPGHDPRKAITSFQAFMVSIASRVGTGNLAGVATALTLGGPGAVFWMWVIALLGAATAFVESTLAQLYKRRGDKGSFVGGPAYYILHGTGKRWWAMTFAILITITFGLAFNSVQSNTIAEALNHAYSVPPVVTGVVLTVLTLMIIWGGIHRIARFSQWVVPIMAVAYIVLALVIVVMNIHRVPEVFMQIIEGAFGINQAVGGTLGMAVVMGVKRGLFSNEAGEGSTPCAAATAAVSHPAKQGLVQALGVYTDTLLICSCTAFIILCSGVLEVGREGGISLTQAAIDSQLPGVGIGSAFVSTAIFFFAFTSIVANYYYGEANLTLFMRSKWLIPVYRLCVGGMVMVGAVASLGVVWTLADLTMALMTVCNLAALVVLGRWAVRCLRDYTDQRRRGLDPQYHRSTIPEIEKQTPCWPE